MAIISVRQDYESIEGQYNYKTEIKTTYRERRQPMDIGKSNDNFKNRKLKYFNYNKYGHIVKECWRKKEKETRKCFKYNKEEHIMKNCKEKQSIKKQKFQEKSDKEDDKDKKKDFGKDLEQAQYKRYL